MSIPDWRTYAGGSMKKAALWLAAEVGEGGTFTKDDLRIAFPRVSQIDRRARDLRDDGWVIHTNREDASLSAGEQRLVTVGGRVWETTYRRKTNAVTSKERQAIFARDDYCCCLCGISGGEPYPDSPLRKAKLTLGRPTRVGEQDQDRSAVFLATLCDRCHRGEPEPSDPVLVQEQIAALDRAGRDRLARWARTGRRSLTAEEAAWAAYRRLPPEARDEIAGRLRNESGA